MNGISLNSECSWAGNFFIWNIWTNFAAQKQNYRIKSFVILIEAIIAGEDDWVKPPSYPVIFCG